MLGFATVRFCVLLPTYVMLLKGFDIETLLKK